MVIVRTSYVSNGNSESSFRTTVPFFLNIINDSGLCGSMCFNNRMNVLPGG